MKSPSNSSSVSLILTAFRQRDYVYEAVQSVLDQSVEDVDVVLSDDASQDGTFAEMQRAVRDYGGAKSVTLIEQPQNLGADHLMACIEQAKGDIFVFFHGDDVSKPDRAKNSVEAMKRTGATLVAVGGTLIDEEGLRKRPLFEVQNDERWRDPASSFEATTHMFHGACFTVARELFDCFPRFGRAQGWGWTDVVFPFRAGLLGGAYFLDQDLVGVRALSTSLGNDRSDWSAAAASHRQMNLSHLLALRVALYKDFQAHRERVDFSPELEAIDVKLREILLAKLSDWSVSHIELMAAGFRPSWLDRKTIHERLKDQPSRLLRNKRTRRTLIEKVAARLRRADLI